MQRTTKPNSMPLLEWRITCRTGMVIQGQPPVKVFTSPTAFDGYVGSLRAHGVVVEFSSPFVAFCKDAA